MQRSGAGGDHPPLCVACACHHIEIARLALPHGAAVNQAITENGESGTRNALGNRPFKPSGGGGRPYRGRIIINSSDLGLSTVDKICRHALIIMRRFFLGKLISGSFVPKISGLGGHGCWAQNWPGMRRPKVTSEIMAHLQMFSPPSAALLLWLRGHLAVAKGKNL